MTLPQAVLSVLSLMTWPVTLCAQLSVERQALLSDGLPVVEVTTINGEEPAAEPIEPPEGCWGASITNATKVPGRICIWQPDGTIAYDSGPFLDGESGMTIKIRGNWSGRSTKKPYKIKLQKKADLLCRNNLRFEDKNWLLLREQATSFNTPIGFKMTQLIGMPWTPALTQVYLIVNGDFRGLYMLCEAVERNANCRIKVNKQTGYIIEYNAYWWKEDLFFQGTFSDTHLRYTFKYPDDEDVTPSQLAYITEATQKMENAIDEGIYPDIIDVHNFASWLLAHDILGTSDAAGSNIYLAKYDDTINSPFFMPTLWDFDTIEKRTGQWASIRVTKEHYFRHLFYSVNKQFAQTYVNLWQQQGENLIQSLRQWLKDFIESPIAQSLNRARLRDTQRWSHLSYHPVEEDIATADHWFSERILWLDSAVATLDTTSISAAIAHVQERTHFHSSPSTIYDLYGRRLSTPPSKDLFIIGKRKFFVKKH